MRSQISKPLYAFDVTDSLQIGTHLNIQLLSTRSVRGFQTFHSELSVVWAKRSLVANIIESKSYNSPLILKKCAFWIHKNKRFVEMVLLSTHETLHIKKYTLYSKSNVSYILFDIYASMYQGSSCWGFTILLQLLKSKNSVQTCFAINNTFASSANMSKLSLLLRWFLARMRL